jgi:hypothetical protein
MIKHYSLNQRYKMLKIILFLTLTTNSLVAAKYEFVRMTHGMTIDLAAGDAAKVVAFTPDASGNDWLILEDNGAKMPYPVNLGDKDTSDLPGPFIIVGPGKLTASLNNAGGRESHFIGNNKYITSTQTVTIAIERSSDTGSKTLAWNEKIWEGGNAENQQASNNSIVPDPSGIKYDSLLGWVWFSDTPWVYSYTNGSWYYLHSMPDGIYVWNANLPNSGWMKLHG